MDEKEFIASLQAEIRDRFMQLTDKEKEFIRSNVGTPYATLLRKVLGEKVLGGLRVAPVTKKTGLGAR
tara:strand:+ start:538 stop:741 length:204 start_codon:yes stop_codon:yes gene_type:complete